MYFVSSINVKLATYVGFAFNNNVRVLGEHVADGLVNFNARAFVVDVFDEDVVDFLSAETFVVAGFKLEGVSTIVVVAAITFSIERGCLKKRLGT